LKERKLKRKVKGLNMSEVEKAEQQEQEVKKTEEQAKKEEKDAEYWRQQAQQNDANARRERQAREEREQEAKDTKAQLEQASQKLKGLEEKVEQQSQYQKMDTDVVDPAVAQNIKALQEQIQGLSGKLGEQSAKIVQYEQVEAKREQERQYNEAVEQICKPLDEEYGQKYRSEARALADKAVEDGTEPKPQTTLEAYILHKKMYSTLAEKTDDSKKTTTTDGGKKTVTVKAEQKAGKFDDVLAEMKSKCKT
jgi:colicin import membrane protein